ncbi:MAG: neutral/alkaline non-lysosomal ceramidase N-terminal domain-containing protein [bacterium]
MTRARSRPKHFRRILLGLFAIVALTIILAVRPVDDTSYFQTSYYAATRARLQNLVSDHELAATRGRLNAGWGRTTLIPPLRQSSEQRAEQHANNIPPQSAFPRLPLAGYSKRHGQPAQGVHDSLYASAIALQVEDRKMVCISLDALIVSRAMADGIMRHVQGEFGLQRHQVMFGATHTHSSLGAWGEGILAEQFAGEHNPGVLQWIIGQSVEAIRRALADLSPASIACGEFSAPRHVANRLVGEKGRVDDGFSFIALRKDNGDHGIIGAYAAHATVLTFDNLQLSADYPGYWRNKIEKAVPGIAVFFAGAVGSHRPQGDGRGFDLARDIGEALADSLLPRLQKAEFHTGASLRTLGLLVDLPPLHLRFTGDFRVAPWLAEKLVHERDSYLQLLALDSLLWIGTPCDFSGEMAAQLKEFSRTNGYQAMFTSFNGSYIGYLLPGKYYYYPAYESRLMSFFGPYMGDYFEELIRRMMLGAAVNVIP